MDSIRTFRWSFSAIEKFTDLARDLLVSKKLLKEDAPYTARSILEGAIKVPGVLRYAVAAAIGEDDPDKMIDAYLEKGGDLQTLENKILEAYYLAADPSHIPAFRERLQIASQLSEIQTQIAKENLRLRETELAGLKAIPPKIPSSGKPPDLAQ
jgi:hypothetical protein